MGEKCVYKVKKIGYVIGDTAYHCLLEKALRITYESRLWKIWRAINHIRDLLLLRIHEWQDSCG